MAGQDDKDKVAAQVYGSLALTGLGHCTDRAILLGLEGNQPATIDPAAMDSTLQRIRTTGRIRLAGTRLREIYDREITGLSIEDLDWGDKHDYWIAAYRRTIEEGKPTQGVVRGPRTHKEHLVQYWLKLPLAAENGEVCMLLCYDYFQSASDDAQMQIMAALA
jgi:hypothetical protein